MLVLALGAALFLAVGAQVAIALLRADAAALHYLAAGGVGQFPGDLDVQLEEPLKRHVRRERLHALRIDIEIKFIQLPRGYMRGCNGKFVFICICIHGMKFTELISAGGE